VVRRLLVFGLVFAGSVVLAAPADAVLSGRNGRIVFTSGRGATAGDDSTARLYLRPVISSTGGGTVSAPITPLGGQSRHGSWSPDRTRIVLANGTPGSPTTEDYDLFVRDLVAGTFIALDATQVGDSLSSDHPAWSPDGSRIAYEQQPADNSADRNIMVKTVGTAAAAVPLTTSSIREFKPAWSPDSSTIYYAKENSGPQYLDIVKRPAGGGAETAAQAASGIDEYQPSISPDGSKMCFTLQTTPGNTSTAEIYTVNLATGTGLTNISDDATQGDINCTWSPDGQYIAYVSGTFTSGALVMKRADDTSLFPVPLEDVAGHFDGNPDWAPDGSPDCPDSAVTTTPGKPITIELECTDTGPAYERTDPNGFVANDGGPQHGTASDHAPLDNPSTVKYTPNPGFKGTDRIIFTSFDDFGFGTDTGTVTIGVASCFGRAATVVGTSGHDALKGTRGRDVIVTLGGKDTVKSFAGKDLLCTGGGRDKVKGGRGNDKAAAGAGADRVIGGAGRDRLFGQAGADRLFGNKGRDRLNGGRQSDLCNGGPGRDSEKHCER
jgi:Tol biopolymer transport system component